MNVKSTVKETRKILYYNLAFYILICLFGLYSAIVSHTLGLSDLLSIAVGIIIVYSLFLAKKWAKTFVTICAAVIVFILIIPTINSFATNQCYSGLWSLSFIIWGVYIIRFLNVGSLYENYSKLVRSGYDISRNPAKDLNEIVAEVRIIPVKAKEIKNINDYYRLTSHLFDLNELSEITQNIELKGDSIIVETENTLWQIEVDKPLTFMNNNFLNQINSILENEANTSERNDKGEDEASLFYIIYPNTVLKKGMALAYLNNSQYLELKRNGFAK